MDFYNSAQNFKLDRIGIPDCINQKHSDRPPLKHRPHAQPGMSVLASIVAGLQKDVKRINACLTIEGAEEYIQKNNKNGWYAWEGDITGPNGVPDVIPEVIITDTKDNIKIVNGYTLTKSTYPQRKIYRSMFQTAGDRKAHPYTELRKRVRMLYPNDQGQPECRLEGSESYHELFQASHTFRQAKRSQS